MKRIVLTGALLALGAAGLLAQPTTAQPPAAAPAPAAPKGPAPKSQGELQALQELQKNAQAGDPDALIKSADDLLTKYPDTDFKAMVLSAEAGAYQQKRDWIKAQIYGEQALAADPKSFQANLLLADILSQHTGEHDLDKEEKLTKAEKYVHQAIDLISTAPKPNPQITDAQWEDYKKQLTGQAQHDLALINMTRKNWDAAIAAFKAAIAVDPQPAYEVQMASCLQSEGKNDEAIALCDKVLAEPNLHPQIKAAAQGIKDNATKAKAK
jgi:tetratricopeptide (TPR) repeat protein